MTERKLFRLFVTDRAVADAVNSGCQTSKDVADKIGAHRVTVQKKMQEMFNAGYLIRRKIGQTYFYAVADDEAIPEDTTEADRAELARKIKAAKK